MAENLCRARARVYPPSVLFLHPDMGVGGAERLVLDAALALQDCGCDVKIWTAHYNPNHCFLETRELSVHCAGDWLPRSLGWGGRGAAICAYVRMVFLALYVLFLSGEEFDVVVCDQVRRPPRLGRGRGLCSRCFGTVQQESPGRERSPVLVWLL